LFVFYRVLQYHIVCVLSCPTISYCLCFNPQ